MDVRSYAHGGSATPLRGETIGELLDHAVALHADAEALVSRQQQVRHTYRSLNAAVDEVAGGLLSLEIERGERVGIWSPNSVEWVLVQFATARIGAILVNINPSYRTAELTYALDHAGCRALIAAPGHGSSDYAAMLAEAAPELPQLEHTVLLGGPDWEAFLERGRAIDPRRIRERQASLDADDPINIQFTSGTTGPPKGATLSHHNLVNNAVFVGECCRYTSADRVCVPLPLYHCFGMVAGSLACVASGACMVLPGASFDPGNVLAAIEEERCTSLYGVPTMFIAELEHPTFDDHDLSSLRTGIMGGSPCPVEVTQRVISQMDMPELTLGFGMTETSPVSTQCRVDDPIEQRIRSVGRVHPHVELRVADPASGRTVERGRSGELLVRGYSVMLGYWDDPARTDEVIDQQGWMHTGDLATMDADGFVNIVGRTKDLIIRGGENISPREVEEVLYAHPAVSDVQVVGVPDDRYGEEVVACVMPRAGHEPTVDELRSFCRERLASFKVPAYVVLVADFPMTVTGKVQKFRLRELMRERLDRHAVATA